MGFSPSLVLVALRLSALALTTLVALPAAGAEPPAPLACLAKWYAVTPVQAEGRWFAALPSGARIPFDDGQHKSFDQMLDKPDVKDAFSQRYPTGPIAPVTSENFDPGRIRLEPVFETTYGGAGIESQLVSIDFLGQRLRVHGKVSAAFGRVAVRLEAAVRRDPKLKPFLTGLGGTFMRRKIAGTNRASSHSYGVSIDLNTKLSNYWRWSKVPRWVSKIPPAIVEAFEAEGFIWGGRWYHYDTMHFEYRPELLAAECYARG
jgi:hypothetical protein